MAETPELIIRVVEKKRGRGYLAKYQTPDWLLPRPVAGETVIAAVQALVDQIKSKAAHSGPGRKPGGFDVARRLVGGK